ncbi:hypothetical protein DYB32_008265 [Aphanomyces invadans]|uniref:Dymeclin n=1 Tax=Aphanomyces invadans TaxID=157072 RepID=A0A3R6Z326_9STRA|nr:hypothetical protein DYB32_008265 [Aphanomyces invadans]
MSPSRHLSDTIATTTTVLATESYIVINVLFVVRHLLKHFIEFNCDVVQLFASEGAHSQPNPFREALATLADRDESTAPHGIPFSHMRTEFHAMLVYHILLWNPPFRDALCRPVDVDHFVSATRSLSRDATNAGVQVMPLLEAIYIYTLDPPRLYVYLAMLVHLSENPLVVQDHVAWFTERYLCDVSGGSVVVLVLCRVLKANLSVLHDPVVQSMALGLLWNVMQFAKALHPSATQSLLKLLAHATKKERQLRAIDTDAASAYLATARDVVVCIELCCRPRLLPSNAQLIYSLLHASDVLDALAVHPNEAFRDDIAPVLGTLAYFKAIVDQAEDQEDEAVADGRAVLQQHLTMEQVLEHIQGGCKTLAQAVRKPELATESSLTCCCSQTASQQPDVYYRYEDERFTMDARQSDGPDFFLQRLWRETVRHTADFAWSVDKMASTAES